MLSNDHRSKLQKKSRHEIFYEYGNNFNSEPSFLMKRGGADKKVKTFLNNFQNITDLRLMELIQ
jgi:hypothetical protein